MRITIHLLLAEGFGACLVSDYRQAALAGSGDLHAAIKFHATLLQIDAITVVVVGHSVGGYAAIALASAHPPPAYAPS